MSAQNIPLKYPLNGDRRRIIAFENTNVTELKVKNSLKGHPLIPMAVPALCGAMSLD